MPVKECEDEKNEEAKQEAGEEQGQGESLRENQGGHESQVDRELRDKESREPLTGIVQRESCQVYIGRAHEPDEAVAQ